MPTRKKNTHIQNVAAKNAPVFLFLGSGLFATTAFVSLLSFPVSQGFHGAASIPKETATTLAFLLAVLFIGFVHANARILTLHRPVFYIRPIK